LNYRCLVTDSSGQIRKIVRQAGSEDAAAASFLSEGLTPLEITLIQTSGRNSEKSIGRKKLLEFTSTFSILLESGLSVKDSIRMLLKITNDKKLLSLAGYIEERLNKGESFSKIIGEMKSTFPPLYRGLVAIGDRVGTLKTVIPSVRDYLVREKKIRDKLINASIYPLMVLGIALSGSGFIAIFILPKLTELFDGMASAVETDLLGRNVSLFTSASLIIFLLILSILLILILGQKNQKIREFTDKFLLSIPGIRSIIQTIEIFNFTFSIEVLTGNGITLSEAIPEAASVCRNTVIKSAFLKINEKISTGSSLAEAFSGQKVIPEKVSGWVGLGEATGNINTIFTQLRLYYEAEIENLSSRFMGIVEPLLILIVGIIIIVLITAFIVPLFSLFGTII